MSGRWTILRGNVLGVQEDVGVSNKTRIIRASMPIDKFGNLLDDVELGEYSPSFAGTIVMNKSNNGWTDWKNSTGDPVDIYRIKEVSE